MYTQLLAEKGHEVTEVEFSASSIVYAKDEVHKKALDIEYIKANYLELKLKGNAFNLVILIFTDLGVLLPAESEQMIRFVHKILKLGGTFIFDVLNDNKLEQKIASNNWEILEEGF